MTAQGLAPTYEAARRRFLDAAAAVGAAVESSVHPSERGPDGEELAIDVARVGPPDSGPVMVVVSGTHGVEGYAGSALQSGWLEGPGPAGRPSGVSVVLLHALNPYGFAWTSRTNEDNVDLNRNFIDWSRPIAHNEAYDDLADLLVPEAWDQETRDATSAALLTRAAEMGADEIQLAVTAGQYRHAGGLFYGGEQPVWSHRWLVDRLPAAVGAATSVGVIDLHTGLGPWGHGELIVHAGRDAPSYRRAEEWWGDVRSMRDGESVSADLSGDWLGRVEAVLAEATVTAAALEFGTVDGIEVLQALRAEAWVRANGDRSSPLAAEARAAVRRAFVDDDPAWLAAITDRFEAVLAAGLVGLGP